MKPDGQFFKEILDLDNPEQTTERLWVAGRVQSIETTGSCIRLLVPFYRQQPSRRLQTEAGIPARIIPLDVCTYGPDMIRLTATADATLPDDASPMLYPAPGIKPGHLTVQEMDSGWNLCDPSGRIRMQVARGPLEGAVPDTFTATIFPDSKTPVSFQATDRFFAGCADSLSLALVTRNDLPDRMIFSLEATPGEHFAGTGERFSRTDLAGQTLVLENADGLGVNNRRCYKNIPFFLSSRPYGCFLHTHVHTRLSLAGISTRAAQGMIEEPRFDCFLIGGGSLERILFHYRELTGFPPPVPLWSYGVWMSRMSYTSEPQVREVARRMRKEQFPCDVLHLDVGWFDEEWMCDWQFGKARFPDPAGMMRDLRADGFRISLWQLPHVAHKCRLFEDAQRRGYVVTSETAGKISDSIFSGLDQVATIDLTNPDALAWYQDMLADLLRLGAAAIKADFGEHIHQACRYAAMPGHRLHNLYALLYQKAVYEITKRVTGEGVLWGRSAWAGSQRYPIHWGGDCAGSWDGLAGSLCGGLQLGLSGFAFWSHDIPGFHGIPDFMNTRPSTALYVRWTQAAVFGSHLRYHGAQPREPYEYPEAAPIVRRWLNLRYALIPYLLDESAHAITTGLPLLAALILHHEDDPFCWHIQDQFYCGRNLLVAPVLNDSGVRDVYLPAGRWVNFWSGERHTGPCLLKAVQSPLEHIPVFAVEGSTLRVYPHPVSSTNDMDLDQSATIVLDAHFKGISQTCLQPRLT